MFTSSRLTGSIDIGCYKIYSSRKNIKMKILPTGNDARFFMQVIFAGGSVVLFKLLQKNNPMIAYMLGFLSISCLIAYLIIWFIKRLLHKYPLNMKLLANNKFGVTQKVLFIFLVFLIASLGFYWYEIRPSKIRQRCSWTTYEDESLSCRYIREMNISNTEAMDECRIKPKLYKTRSTTPNEYDFCIRSNGLLH